MKLSTPALLQKYNVPAPRYTSYPTVPYWQKESPKQFEWIHAVQESFAQSNEISLYIHLPFCEKLCTYCGCNTKITKRHSVELPYIKAILTEWANYLALFDRKPILKELHLGGGTPTFFSPKSLDLLISTILDSVMVPKEVDYGFEAHPNSTTEAHLTTLRKLGFNRLSIGIQDFNQNILKLINRFQTEEQISFLTKKAQELGYQSINYDLIFGLPTQTPEDIIYSMEKVVELKPDRLAFYSYAHVPWIKGSQRAYSEKDLPTDHEKRKLYEIGRQLLVDNGYKEIGLDHFALPTDSLAKALDQGDLYRNFMGYTPAKSNLMIGLGASSISETATAYVQNIKQVKAYQKMACTQEIPFFKGHLLTEDDQMMKQLITEIMCQKGTDWHKLDLATIDDIRFKLKELEEDGLVVTSHYDLKVTEAGLPFLRNICMALDNRLWANKPKTNLFSQAV